MSKTKGRRSKKRRMERQVDAELRQEERNKRSHKEQLELIKSRRGESKREKHRLVSLIEQAYEKANRSKSGKKSKRQS